MKQYYNIAGLTVMMEGNGRIETQARAYRTAPCAEPDIVIEVEDSLRHEYQTVYRIISDDVVEYMATAGVFYRQLLEFDGFMLHSSAVVVDGRAYLFSATSGTGKSTHTGLWLKQFGDSAYILNDDKPAIRLEDGVWYAYGTPWSGKNDISVNARVPIAGIAVLERGQTNEIQRFSGKDAVLSIMKQTNHPKAARYRIKLLDLLDKLMTQVPIWKLKCNMEPEAAIVAYEAMSGEKWRK